MRKLIDLTGKRFGKWIVIKRALNRGHHTYWLCKCDCGVDKEVVSRSLTNGDSESCGCSKLEIDSLIGQRFGRLVVIERVKNKGAQTRWLCKCDCGKEKEIDRNNLISGGTTSCGCLFREKASEVNKIEYGLYAKHQVFNGYQQRSKRDAIIFELSFDEFINLTQQNCYYCGDEPSNFRKSIGNNGDFKYNGIDRIDSTKGYTIENCVPCCFICNQAKRDLSVSAFINWVEKIYMNLKKLRS